MKKTNQRDRQPKPAKPVLPARRVPVWLPGAMLVLLLVGIAVVVWAMNRQGAGSEIASGPAAPASSSALSAEVRHRLVGRWLRPDGGYVLAIEGIAEDGKVTATYSNPQPINVAKAQATHEGGKTSLYVELRDRGYPGNYYTLVYDAGRDQFTGVYHQLGIGQTFDVNFERLPKEVNGKE